MKLYGDWREPDLPERDMEPDDSQEWGNDPNDDWEYDDDDPRCYHGEDAR